MRKLIGTFGLMVLFSALAFPGGLERQAASSNLQAGYAVVTPSAPGSMVVFETFAMWNAADVWQAGVLPSDLTTHAVVFVDNRNSMATSLGVAMVNPNATAANVTLTLNNADGTVASNTTATVGANQQVARFITELFANAPNLPPNIIGTLSIQSNVPIAVVGLRFRGANFSTIPVTNLAPGGSLPVLGAGVGGAGAIVLPQFVAGGNWGTQLVLSNTGANAIVVRVDLFANDGTLLTTTMNGVTSNAFTNMTIPAGGVVVLQPSNWDNSHQ